MARRGRCGWATRAPSAARSSAGWQSTPRLPTRAPARQSGRSAGACRPKWLARAWWSSTWRRSPSPRSCYPQPTARRPSAARAAPFWTTRRARLWLRLLGATKPAVSIGRASRAPASRASPTRSWAPSCGSAPRTTRRNPSRRSSSTRALCCGTDRSSGCWSASTALPTARRTPRGGSRRPARMTGVGRSSSTSGATRRSASRW
mmetsp:Transcript_9651/g.32057  ORF Transcript_9651/g.32057 Transcript_9651/m.32057 type:complete len:204 (+) Transcript_9651:2213-2824(+)